MDVRPRTISQKDLDLLGDIAHLVRRELMLMPETAREALTA